MNCGSFRLGTNLDLLNKLSAKGAYGHSVAAQGAVKHSHLRENRTNKKESHEKSEVFLAIFYYLKCDCLCVSHVMYQVTPSQSYRKEHLLKKGSVHPSFRFACNRPALPRQINISGPIKNQKGTSTQSRLLRRPPHSAIERLTFRETASIRDTFWCFVRQSDMTYGVEADLIGSKPQQNGRLYSPIPMQKRQIRLKLSWKRFELLDRQEDCNPNNSLATVPCPPWSTRKRLSSTWTSCPCSPVCLTVELLLSPRLSVRLITFNVTCCLCIQNDRSWKRSDTCEGGFI